ncbi:hypothetical protein VNO77_18401 [Canavalia gladiata]|uniref:Uncharacterized protein n=1 Tax=Canavalia gladiata TaxID=3824 RepID=A0AAN9LKR3_CANGL
MLCSNITNHFLFFWSELVCIYIALSEIRKLPSVIDTAKLQQDPEVHANRWLAGPLVVYILRKSAGFEQARKFISYAFAFHDPVSTIYLVALLKVIIGIMKIEGNNAKADDAIMINEDGYVSEPNATSIVVELVVKEQLILEERRISLSEVDTADEHSAINPFAPLE